MRSRRIRFPIKRERILRLRRLSAASLRMTRFFYLPDKRKFDPFLIIFPSWRKLSAVIKMESLWSDYAIPQYDALQGNRKTDVLVIGGGMAGLLCAHQLQTAGVDVVVAEARRICGGVTRNTTAKVTSQHGLIYNKLLQQMGMERAKMYLQANQSAIAQYRALCAEMPCHWEEKANYVYSEANRQALEEEASALHRMGFPATLKSRSGLPFPVAGALEFRKQGQFHPLEFAAGIAEKLTVYENTPVLAIEGSTAQCPHGKIKAEKIIVATHFPFINSHGSYFMKLYQQRSYVLALEGGPDVDGMYIGMEKNSLSFRTAGNYLLLGGGGHRTGKQGGGWRVLEDLAARHYPGAAIARRWATQDCMSLDGIPYIGNYSARTPELYVATGFNKWGMTGSMVSAMLLTELITKGESDYAALFSPSRSMCKPQLAVNALESVSNLLRPTRPRCTHMGCALHWNKQEHSWDCACHGSRFSKDGKLLNNPARRDLPK